MSELPPRGGNSDIDTVYFTLPNKGYLIFKYKHLLSFISIFYLCKTHAYYFSSLLDRLPSVFRTVKFRYRSIKLTIQYYNKKPIIKPLFSRIYVMEQPLYICNSY